MRQAKKSEEQKLTIEESIEKTGYVLEHKVASMFEKAKWSVIHNRYYLDDVTAISREMDMIAYKTVLLDDDIRIFTALIISCKKNSEFDWAFLTRKAPGMNININMLPVNFNSNYDIFNHQLSKIDWTKEKFIKSYDSNSLIKAMYNYDRIVFAYQEIRKTNNAPSNDSNIFSSIASLIKAQAFEINSLEGGRKKNKKYVYNINLLSVADLDFYELHYDKEKVNTKSIDRINYLNRFLISSQEQHSKIDFIKFQALEGVIEEYNTLHDWNIKFYQTLVDDFYRDVFSDYAKKDLIIKKTKDDYLWHVRYYTSGTIEDELQFLIIDIDSEFVLINISDNESINVYLNSHEKVKSHTRDWLATNFKYIGPFKFTEDLLPF